MFFLSPLAPLADSTEYTGTQAGKATTPASTSETVQERQGGTVICRTQTHVTIATAVVLA